MRAIKTDDAPSAPKLYSQAIEHNGFVFTAGQIHLNGNGELIGKSMTEKIQQVLVNLEAILKGADLDFSNVIKVTVYITDMSEYGEFNNYYVTRFSEPMPAREVVCVKELPLGANLEISMVAVR